MKEQNGAPPKTNARRYALAGVLFGLLFPLFATIIRVLDLGLPLTVFNMATVQTTDPLLWIIDTAPFILSFFAAIAGRRQDALEKLNDLLKAGERELEASQSALEQRVRERTLELTSQNQLVVERATQFRSVVDMTHSLLMILDLDSLLSQAAQEITRQFNCHQVDVYLLDEQKQHIVLKASSSEGDRRIPDRGQHLRIDGTGPVEDAVRSGQIVYATEKVELSDFDPELPNTRSRLVLPLKNGEIVLGALDLQSDDPRIFTEEFVSVLSLLADQVAIAIQNSILHEKTQRTLREIEAGSREVSAQGWGGWVDSIRSRGYRYDGIRAEPVKEPQAPVSMEKKVHSIPIRLRGRTIGNLKVKFSDISPGWTEDDHAIAAATAERTALALEGARLLDEAKKRAAREAFLSDMAAKLSTSFQLDSILRDTVAELGQTLEGATVSFQLIDPSTPPKLDPSADRENME